MTFRPSERPHSERASKLANKKSCRLYRPVRQFADPTVQTRFKGGGCAFAIRCVPFIRVLAVFCLAQCWYAIANLTNLTNTPDHSLALAIFSLSLSILLSNRESFYHPLLPFNEQSSPTRGHLAGIHQTVKQKSLSLTIKSPNEVHRNLLLNAVCSSSSRQCVSVRLVLELFGYVIKCFSCSCRFSRVKVRLDKLVVSAWN